MKYKNIHRIPFGLADYTARGVVPIIKEELEEDSRFWEILNVETVYTGNGEYYFVAWVGELKLKVDSTDNCNLTYSDEEQGGGYLTCSYNHKIGEECLMDNKNER